MENISGYARILARTRVEQQVNKSFLGKTYVKYGQCFAISAYFFQLGGILGAKHCANPDAFGHAFLGVQGDPGAVVSFFRKVAKNVMARSVDDSMTFLDYVCADMSDRIGHTGNAESFMYSHATLRIDPAAAEEAAWQYAEKGAALGAIHPHAVRQMFERTHAAVPPGDWEQAHAAGLDIPPEQDLFSYEETEEDEDAMFMAYCRECCPRLYSVLTA